MNNDATPPEPTAFGEKLLGMQGFNAERARRYREELERLLVHRITRFERWSIGICGVLLAAAFVGGGAAWASAKPPVDWPGIDQFRLTTAATTAVTGLAAGAWLLYVAVRGGYGRQRGDVVGIFISLLFCGGWAVSILNVAWDIGDPDLRAKFLLAGTAIFAGMAACVILAHFQRLHRQTQEKLLRIECHLAELMDRTPDPSN